MGKVECLSETVNTTLATIQLELERLSSENDDQKFDIDPQSPILIQESNRPNYDSTINSALLKRVCLKLRIKEVSIFPFGH